MVLQVKNQQIEGVLDLVGYFSAQFSTELQLILRSPSWHSLCKGMCLIKNYLTDCLTRHRTFYCSDIAVKLHL